MITPAKDWTQTYSGGKFHPADPRPEEINIRDIAHHLSMLCRYTGAPHRFYSVAEHSVLVAYRAAQLSSEKDCLTNARWGLLHDASEAYLQDISRPLKHHWRMGGYRILEERLQPMIARKFGLPPEQPELVRQVDAEVLGTELVQLMVPLHPDWDKLGVDRPAPPIRLPESMSTLGLLPDAAEDLFIRAYRVLFEGER
jgi:hypothetical protein